MSKNPFLLYGYDGPEYFCDRESETKRIISALRNGRNITLLSPRRMGKTGLIFQNIVRLRKFLDKSGIPVGSAFAQPVMHMRNPQPFNAERFAVLDKIMRQANRIQPARNCKQQAFETMMANMFN